MSRLCEYFQASLNHQKNDHVRRIVDIKEPLVKILMPDISALSVIHRDRYEREKGTVLKPAKINQ